MVNILSMSGVKERGIYTKSHNLDRHFVGQKISLYGPKIFFIKGHLWSWQNHPVGKLVQIAQQLVLLTQIAKLCCAIRPPCHPEEPPPAEVSLCLDTDFTPDANMCNVIWTP